MIKILLLSAGTNACYHCAKILKEKFKNYFYIVGVDINEQYLIPSCNYLDKFYQAPRSDSPEYYSFILKICKEENINYILPSFDIDQKLFYPENKDLLKLNIISLSTNKEALEIYDNKDNMNKFLKKNGFNIPKIFNIKEIKDDLDYFIKPKNGVGSIGAQILKGKEIKHISKIDDILIQEICLEPEYTVECFHYKNETRTITRERIASKSGVCTKTFAHNNYELENIVKNFTDKIKCPYYFNIQFMKNSNNEFVITDVNFRLAGGMSLSYAAGWDEISALVNLMLNKTNTEIFKTLPKTIKPQYIIRAYTDIVTKVEKPIVAFDFDGTLLDSRARHRLVLNDILETFNIKLDTSDLIEFKRNGKNNIEYLLSKNIDSKLASKIQNLWIENIEKDEYLNSDILYPETIDLLEKYSRDNDLILITARNNKKGLHNQIDKYDLKKYFKEIFVVNSGKNTIYDKSLILKEQSAIIFIGDTISDKKSADNANIKFIHLDSGFHSQKYIKDNHD